MKILIACEESQAVCKEFRIRGHEAYSCDIVECSGGHPEWHIQGDALRIINLCLSELRTSHPRYHAAAGKKCRSTGLPPDCSAEQ